MEPEALDNRIKLESQPSRGNNPGESRLILDVVRFLQDRTGLGRPGPRSRRRTPREPVVSARPHQSPRSRPARGGLRGNWALAARVGWALVFMAAGRDGLRAGDLDEVNRQLLLLRQQNEQLQKQIGEQQQLIEKLNQKVSTIETAEKGRSNELNSLKAEVQNPPPPPPAPELLSGPWRLGNAVFSGEGGAGFIHQGSGGEFHQAQFLIDEAKLFLDAKIWTDVYFYSEINLAAREEQAVDENLHLGELYLDAESVLRRWGPADLLNVRVGRFYIPFGEEYLARFVIDDPLISHSASDIWGLDEGVELYGSGGKFHYVAAVQNGGQPLFSGYHDDKSVSGRVGFDPAGWLHLSASAMRTGDLDAGRDGLSAVWFGNGFFRPIGSAATTSFHANLAEGDVQLTWPGTHLKSAGGFARYGDNDPAADNSRNLYYYYAEGTKDLAEKLYAAVRLSQIFAPGGYPIAGEGNYGEYYLSDAEMTSELTRLSLGLGYRWSPNLILKAEYSLEWGRLANGERRPREDLMGAELGFKF